MEAKLENAIRKEKGIRLAKTYRIIKREKGGYTVPSESGDGTWIVKFDKFQPSCNCPDFEKRGLLGVKCKHIWVVELLMNGIVKEAVKPLVIEGDKPTYQQNWPAYNLSQVREKQLFMELLADLCKGLKNPKYKFGRPSMPLADMAFSCAYKVFSTISGRRFSTDIKTAKENGYIDVIPHYNTLFVYFRKEELTPILKRLIQISAVPLASVETDFAVDASGFSTQRYARWFDFKYGRDKNMRIWLKAHIMCGVKTNIVTSADVTEGYSADIHKFPALVAETAKSFNIAEVSADKAYSSVDNLQLIDELGATAFIPFKTNTSARAQKRKIWKRLYHYFMYNREEFLQHYHKRSNVETTFHMIKAKFGSYVRNKNKVAEVNEVLCKILCHNICVLIQEMHTLGIEPKFPHKKSSLKGTF